MLIFGNFYLLRKKIKFHEKNKIVYKYEGGPRQRASDKMHKYGTLKRCHLPDLDMTIPVSHEITWGRPLTEQEIDHLGAWAEANAAVNEINSKAGMERMNAVVGAQYQHRLYIEFKWHRMVMRLLLGEWHCGTTTESDKKDKDV